MSLASVIRSLANAVTDICPTGQILSLKLSDEDACSLLLKDVDDKSTLRISIQYLEPASYPCSGVLVLSEDASSRLADKLSSITERFQDKAPLSLVLHKICDVLDIPAEEDPLRSAEGSSSHDAQNEAGSGSGMQEDASAESMSEDASYNDSDDGDDGDEQEDKELLVECGQRQGRWNRYEEELEKAQSSQQQLSMDQGKASKRQIFSSQEAFRMLSNELLGFIRRQYQGSDVSADSAGDDLYTWNVELWKSAFKRDGQLAKDMQEVSTKWAVSSIQLRFTFMRGLHPFYPPRLEVVRPHLSGPLPGALSSHPLLRLEHWDPWMNMSQLLDKIKEFLEAHGRIDVSHPRNSQALFPSSAFSPVEVALARLEAITTVKPACYNQHRDIYEGRSTQSSCPAGL
eukprot:GHRR01021037.1.p1 GENE.GHRR01021037.1~~GHRR01021037.1.p1  ORF type:complete len:401 (+),score=118.20 GHRR01021037.1:516-1718(+)